MQNCVIQFMLLWTIDIYMMTYIPFGRKFVTMGTLPMASQIELCIVCSGSVTTYNVRVVFTAIAAIEMHRMYRNLTGLWGEDSEITTKDTSLYCEACMEGLRDHVIKWKHFPRYCPFVRGIHWSPVNSPHKGQWRGALVFSLICASINGSVNNGEVGDLKHHRAHYDVTVMVWF